VTEVLPPTAATRGRRAFHWFSLVAVVAIPLAAIVWLFAPRAACACTPAPSIPASPIDGVVVAVDSTGLGQVRGFTLRADGVDVVLQLGNLQNATEFSPSHLAEHMATSERVRVWYRLESGQPLVYRLEDAPG
jgi:hypothetical protein